MKKKTINELINESYFYEDTKAMIASELDKNGISKNKEGKDFDQKEIEMGIKVEQEHIKDDAIAQEIAEDHLIEDPKYYTHLLVMEKIGKLKIPDLWKKILTFFDDFKSYKDITDEPIHKFSEENKIPPNKFEAEIYKMLWFTKDLFNK